MSENTEQTRVDKILEATITEVNGRGMAITMPFSALGGLCIGISAGIINENLRPPETINCSVEVPIETSTVSIEDMSCHEEVPYNMLTMSGSAIIGGIALYKGWQHLVRKKLGSERYNTVKNPPRRKHY